MIHRASVMPNGRLLERMSWVFDCPACEYAWAATTREAIETQALTHCTCAGGTAHDAVRRDLLIAGSPLFGEFVA